MGFAIAEVTPVPFADPTHDPFLVGKWREGAVSHLLHLDITFITLPARISRYPYVLRLYIHITHLYISWDAP